MALVEQVVPESHDQLRFPIEGEPATYVIEGLLVHGRVSGFIYHSDTGQQPAETSIRRRDVGGNVRECRVSLTDEGLTWVQGHVTEKDEAGQALLAADALTRDLHRGPVLRFEQDTQTVALRGMSFPLDARGHPAIDLPASPSPEDRFHIETVEQDVSIRHGLPGVV